MRIVYEATLSKPIIVEDFWPLPFLGGTFRSVEKDGAVVAFELSFANQPLTHSPKVTQTPDDPARKAQITLRDQLEPLVRFQLEEALAFVRCYFDIELHVDELKARYIGESAEEESQIAIKTWHSRRAEKRPSISFEYFSQGIMAASRGPAPTFEATLVSAARIECLRNKYIDSFRYSFLLIEARYGRGKSQTKQLKDALKQSVELRTIVTECLQDPQRPAGNTNSDTDKLLRSSPSVDELLDHLVNKRGFFFHGNLKGNRGWRPERQQDAEGLCLFALSIAMGISHLAAAPMFSVEFEQEHFANAQKAGALMSLQVDFRFQESGDPLDRRRVLTIRVPGTRVTPKTCLSAAQLFLKTFEEDTPTANLKSASCKEQISGQPVFEMTFHATSKTTEQP